MPAKGDIQVKYKATGSGSVGLGNAYKEFAKHTGAMGKAMTRTTTVNDAFYKSAVEYKKSVRNAAKGSFKSKTGNLMKMLRSQAVKAVKGKINFRPSAIVAIMTYLLRWFDAGTKPRTTKSGASRGYIKARPFIERGIRSAKSQAERALTTFLRKNEAKAVREANKLAKGIVG